MWKRGYYDPELGRFISPDPLLDGLNRYAYCGNNPVTYVDPHGLERIYLEDGSYYDTTGGYQEDIEEHEREVREAREREDLLNEIRVLNRERERVLTRMRNPHSESHLRRLMNWLEIYEGGLANLLGRYNALTPRVKQSNPLLNMQSYKKNKTMKDAGCCFLTLLGGAQDVYGMNLTAQEINEIRKYAEGMKWINNKTYVGNAEAVIGYASAFLAKKMGMTPYDVKLVSDDDYDVAAVNVTHTWTYSSGTTETYGHFVLSDATSDINNTITYDPLWYNPRNTQGATGYVEVGRWKFLFCR